MSDFLRHLVDRAQDRVVRLERRRPSLFEARAPAATDLREFDEPASPSTPVATVATVAPTPPHIVHTSAAEPATPLPAPGRLTAPAREASIAPPARALHDASPQPAASERASPSAPQPDRIDPAQGAPHVLSVPAPLPARAAPSPIASTPTREAHRDTTVEHVHSQVEVRIERERETAPTAARSRAVEPHDVLARPARLEPPAPAAPTLAHPARRAANQSRVPAAPAPVPVQVSIGRVEIRATHAPAPAAARSPAKTPAPALEDYLRRRHGDQR
ncbi:MAG: hypothetical protein ACREP7_09890 [Lysobacter sp.]